MSYQPNHQWRGGWVGPVLGFLFLFLLFKGWFLFPLLFFLFFVMPAMRSGGFGWMSCDTDSGEQEKHKNGVRFIDQDDAPKRKNDQRRTIRTVDGDELEII